MNRKITSIHIAITVLLLGVLGWRIDWNAMRTTIVGVRLLPFLAACVAFMLCLVLAALRLQVLLRPTALRFGWIRLLEVNFISLFYGLFLPSGVGAAAVRWYKITGNRLGRRVFLLISLLEQLMFISSLLLCTTIPLLLDGDGRIEAFRLSALPLLLPLTLVCLFLLLCFFSRTAFRGLAACGRWLQDKIRLHHVQQLIGIYEDVGLYVDQRRLLLISALYQVILQAMLFGGSLLLFAALDLDLPLATVLWVSMLVLLLQAVPISLAGFGVREAGFAVLLGLYGISPEKGALLGGMVSANMLLYAFLGGVLSLLDVRGRRD